MSIENCLNENLNEKIIYKLPDSNEEVKIIDNFFSNEILEKIIDYFNNNNWYCNCIKDININLYSDPPYWEINLTHETFFNSYLKKNIENYFNKQLKTKRIYSVGQTYGQNSSFHIDDKNKNTYTFCYYINKNISINNDYDDGLFYLRVPDKKYIITIEPIMNRMVIFPSTYRHKGSGVSRFNNDLRVCITWKFSTNFM